MAYFRFIGDPKQRDRKWKEAHPGYVAEDPTSIVLFATGITQGTTFVRNGEGVEVSDSAQCARLRGNGHFEEVDGPKLEAGDGHSSGGDGGQPSETTADPESENPVPKKRGRGRPRKNVG